MEGNLPTTWTDYEPEEDGGIVDRWISSWNRKICGKTTVFHLCEPVYSNGRSEVEVGTRVKSDENS